MLGDPPQPDRVQVTGPLEVRARRFDVLYLLGLQEGEFPGPARSDPFLSDDDRREIAQATGLALPVREDQLDRERYLFYVCASRAERMLVLSSRTSDEEGRPQQPSFFLEDVRHVLDLPARPHAVRGLSDVVWDLSEAPTRQEWERAAAAAGPRVPHLVPDRLESAELVRRLVEEFPLSAGAIEAFAGCPVKWLLERRLRPEAARAGGGAARARRLRAPCPPARLLRAGGARRAPDHAARTWRRPSACSSTRCATSRRSSRSRLTGRACAPRSGSSSSTSCATCATRPTARPASSPTSSSCRSEATARSGSRSGSTGSASSAASTASTRTAAARSCATTRPAAPEPTTARASGSTRTGSRSPSTCSR